MFLSVLFSFLLIRNSLSFLCRTELTDQTFPSNLDPTRFQIFDSSYNPMDLTTTQTCSNCLTYSVFGGKTNSGAYLFGKSDPIYSLNLTGMTNSYPIYQVIAEFTILLYANVSTGPVVFKTSVFWIPPTGGAVKTTPNSPPFNPFTSFDPNLLACDSPMAVYSMISPMGANIPANSQINVSFYSGTIGSHWGIRNISITFKFCDPTCLTCSSQMTCTTCTPGAIKLTTSCSCVGKYYWTACPNPNNTELCSKKCLPCTTNCASCNYTGCITCSAGYYLTPTLTCASSCPAGSVAVGTVCQCQSPCQTCQTTVSFCLSCIANYYLYGNTCLSPCPSGYSPDANNVCQLCDATCFKCNGITSSNCTSCNGTLFLYQNSCRSDCPDYYYAANNLCNNCSSTCKTCNGPLNTNCLSCDSPYALFGSQCLSPCPNGFYDLNHICTTCHISCQTCNGGTSTSCLSCNGTKLFYINECIDSCPEHYYAANNNCNVCDSTCANCTGGSNTNCLSCYSPRALFNSQCPTTCPDGFYNLNNVCTQCDLTCATCNGSSSTNCVSCNGTKLLYQTECRNNCPEHYFANGNTCTACDSTCANCSAGSNTNCLSCYSPRALFNSQCTTTCPDGFYNLNNVCTVCDLTCATCNGGNNAQCLSCNGTKSLYQSTCINTCPDHYYAINNVCTVCDTTCDNCSGASNTNCLSCYSPKALFNNQCLTVCPDGFYNLNNVCTLCDSTCATCNGGSSTNCVTCNGTRNYYNGECKNNCPDHYYANNNICTVCDSSCANCSGGLSTNCLSCYSPKALFNSQCLATCPNGFYKLNNVCTECGLTCATCNGGSATNCLSCNGTTSLYLGECKNSCPEHYYSNNNVCTICDSSCANCSGGSSTNCLSCYSPKALYNSQCLTNCPNGFHNSNNVCIPILCDPSCATCDGISSRDCLSCNGTKLLYEKQCINTCPDHYFPLNNVCQACDLSCANCNGSTSNNCTSCNSGYFLLNSTCYNPCPNKYFGKNSLCLPCDTTCLTCRESSATDCLTCNPPLVFYSYSCIPNCPSGFVKTSNGCSPIPSSCSDGTYPEISTGTCQPCNQSCTKCFGPLYSNCTECSANFYLSGTTCVPSCPNGTFQNEVLKQCIICDVSCKTCFGTSSNQCLSCVDPTKVLNDGSCIDNCPDDKFPDVKDKNICKPCGVHCLVCLSLSGCKICDNSTYLTTKKTCSLPTGISFSVNSTSNPVLFELIFSNQWNYLKTNINKILNVNFTKNETTKMSVTVVSVMNSSTNPNGVLVNLKYSQNFPAKLHYLMFSLSVDNKSELSSEYYLLNENEIVLLDEYKQCLSNEYFNPNSLKCIQFPQISPYLFYTTRSDQIILQLTNTFPLLNLLIYQFSRISIEGMSHNDYTYKINSTSSIYSFIITLATNKTITGGPKLTFTLIIPTDIISSQNVQIQSDSAQIKLLDFNTLSNDDKHKADEIKTHTENANKAATSTTYANFILSTGHPFLLQGMMLTEMIQLLKYLEISYPEMVLEMFKANTNLPTLMFNYEFENSVDDVRKIPQLYTYYGVSPYFLENAGEQICKNLVLLGIGYILVIFLEKATSTSFLVKILNFVYSIVVWQFVLFFMLMYFQRFVFYTISNLVFRSESDNGTKNLIMASFFFVIEIGCMAHLFMILKVLRFIKGKQSPVEMHSAHSNKIFIEEVEKDPVSLQRIFFNNEKSPTSFEAIKTNDALPFSVEKQMSKNTSNNSIPSPLMSPMKDGGKSPRKFKKVVVMPTIEESQLPPPKLTFCQKIKNGFIFFKRVLVNFVSFGSIYHPKNDTGYMRKYEFLHVSVKNDSFCQSYYFFFDYLRLLLISWLIGFHFNAFMQIFLINIVNVAFIIFYLIVRPYHSKLVFYCSLLSEIMTEIALLSALAIAILDLTGDKTTNTRIFFGWAIVGMNIALFCWICVLGIIKILLIVHERRKRLQVKTTDVMTLDRNTSK